MSVDERVEFVVKEVSTKVERLSITPYILLLVIVGALIGVMSK